MLGKPNCERVADTYRNLNEPYLLNLALKGVADSIGISMWLRKAIPSNLLKVSAAEQIWYGHPDSSFLHAPKGRLCQITEGPGYLYLCTFHKNCALFTQNLAKCISHQRPKQHTFLHRAVTQMLSTVGNIIIIGLPHFWYYWCKNSIWIFEFPVASIYH